MKISVITPYYNEPLEMLKKCHQSVLDQTVNAKHIFAADGNPRKELDKWDAEHFILPYSHNDYGGTPRALAALSAFQRGSDAICFLDADNWYTPGHVQEMLKLHTQSGADICITCRQLYTVSGEKIHLSAEEDMLDNFADTNSLWMTKAAMPLLSSWIFMGSELSACGDFIFYQEIKASGLKIAREKKQTVCYQTRWKGHYEKAGLTPPENAETKDTTASTCAWFRNLPGRERETLRRLFRSNLDIFKLEKITVIDDAYIRIPDGIALQKMNCEQTYEVSDHTTFHIPKEFFPDTLAFSGVVMGITAMDDWTLDGTFTHRGQEFKLTEDYNSEPKNNEYYFEHTIDWTRIDYNMKFELNSDYDRKYKIVWWIEPFTW